MAEILKLSDYRTTYQYHCTCGSNIFKLESEIRKTLIVCAHCGAINHLSDITSACLFSNFD